MRQLEANRRNATRSTGPSTTAGKKRSRQNAVRHGLCAETVIGVLEDIKDYKSFEAAIIADFNAETAVERELVLRLASLLWRIRRATGIETALFQIQAEILQERRLDRSLVYLELGVPDIGGVEDIDRCGGTGDRHSGQELNSYGSRWHTDSSNTARDLAYSFQRIVNMDGATFEKLERYQTALSRQIAQTLLLLRHERQLRYATDWQSNRPRKHQSSIQDRW